MRSPAPYTNSLTFRPFMLKDEQNPANIIRKGTESTLTIKNRSTCHCSSHSTILSHQQKEPRFLSPRFTRSSNPPKKVTGTPHAPSRKSTCHQQSRKIRSSRIFPGCFIFRGFFKYRTGFMFCDKRDSDKRYGRNNHRDRSGIKGWNIDTLHF